MKRIVMRLGMSGLLYLAGSGHALANHYCEAEVCVVRDDRPQWVMVFSVSDDGQLFLEGRNRTALFVGAGNSHGECVSWDEGYTHRGMGGYHVVVTSDRPFALPRNFHRKQSFHVRSQWRAEHSKRLCKLLGVRPGAVHVNAYAFEPDFRRHRDVPIAPSCGHSAWPWAGVAGSDQVYVDGIFRGLGVSALFSVGSGGHRVTVVTAQGRKQTRWVSFSASSCGSSCPARMACR